MNTLIPISLQLCRKFWYTSFGWIKCVNGFQAEAFSHI